MSDLKGALSRYVQEQTPNMPPSFDGVDVRVRHRSHRRMGAIAAVPVVLAAALVAPHLATDPHPPGSEPAPGRLIVQAPSLNATSNPPVAPSASQGPISPYSFAKCAEGYDLTTLKRRAFAFDGTVSRIAPLRPPVEGSSALPGYLTVTFTVHEWFRGGDQATVAVGMIPVPAPGRMGSPEGTSLHVGTRLLVSGEPRIGGRPLQDPIAWGCGFTRIFDQATAAAWRQTFGKR